MGGDTDEEGVVPTPESSEVVRWTLAAEGPPADEADDKPCGDEASPNEEDTDEDRDAADTADS